MRDIVGDKKFNKITLVVKLGFKKAKIYHSLLIILGLFFSLIAIGIDAKNLLDLLPFLFILPLFIHLIQVHKTEVPKNLDPELKKVALSTFGISLVWMLLNLIN